MNTNAGTDNREIEAKYIIDKKDIPRIDHCLNSLKEEGRLMIAGTRTVDFTDFYFDTPDLLLAFNSCSLRLRERPGHPTKLTFKKALTTTENGLHSRIEVEGIPTKRLISEVLREAPWIAIRQKNIAEKTFSGHVELMHSIGVFNTFRIENKRTIHTVVTPNELYAEVSIDHGRYRKDNIDQPLTEFEIEYLSGNRDKMPDLCELITSELGGLKHHTHSKYMRGLRMLGMWKDRKNPGSKRFKRWKNELNSLFNKFEKFYAKALDFNDPRVLHKTRVTIRKIDTLLNFLPDVPESSKSGAFVMRTFKTILKRLGMVRDYDVLIENTRASSDRPNDLIALIELKRSEEILNAIRTFNTINSKKLKKSWNKFISKELKTFLGQASIEQHYINLKGRFRRSIIEFHNSSEMRGIAHPMTVRKLHKARIALKALRYATEYIDILSPGSPEIDIQHYKQLQDTLGEINDQSNEIAFYQALTQELGSILSDDIDSFTAVLAGSFKENLHALDISQLSPSVVILAEQPDLTEIKGIGERTKQALHDAGIRSVDDLAQLEEEQLHRDQEISEHIVSRAIREDWIGQARKLSL